MAIADNKYIYKKSYFTEFYAIQQLPTVSNYLYIRAPVHISKYLVKFDQIISKPLRYPIRYPSISQSLVLCHLSDGALVFVYLRTVFCFSPSTMIILLSKSHFVETSARLLDLGQLADQYSGR